MNWTSAQHHYGDGAAYRAYRDAYFAAQDQLIAAQFALAKKPTETTAETE
jgi:hypothetical protein